MLSPGTGDAIAKPLAPVFLGNVVMVEAVNLFTAPRTFQHISLSIGSIRFPAQLTAIYCNGTGPIIYSVFSKYTLIVSGKLRSFDCR
jgi:hypothetical protein